ncbi:MAG: pyruvate ferredoxin oxidoreductase subunit gamma [Candidatus Woesearchaeota archaeon]
MLEVRIHGRGGQGAVTTGQIMAIAAFYDGKQSQTFPMFGVERAGAPVQAYCRISNKKINIRSQVYHPDIVLVLDSSLLEAVDVTSGLKENGVLIVNTNKSREEVIKYLEYNHEYTGRYDVHVVDATSIALEIFKRPIVNTPMLGAFSKISGIVSIKSLKLAVDEVFSSKGADIAELNKRAIEEVFNATK